MAVEVVQYDYLGMYGSLELETLPSLCIDV